MTFSFCNDPSFFSSLLKHFSNLTSSQKECSYKAWRKHPWLCLSYSRMKKYDLHMYLIFVEKSPAIDGIL